MNKFPDWVMRAAKKIAQIEFDEGEPCNSGLDVDRLAEVIFEEYSKISDVEE